MTTPDAGLDLRDIPRYTRRRLAWRLLSGARTRQIVRTLLDPSAEWLHTDDLDQLDLGDATLVANLLARLVSTDLALDFCRLLDDTHGETFATTVRHDALYALALTKES